MKNETLQIRLGATIRRSRENAGLTQARLAALCGSTAPALSLIENGRVDARLSTVAAISKALEFDLAAVVSPPRRRTVVDVLETRARNAATLQRLGYEESDPAARLAMRAERGEDVTAEQAVLSSR